MKLIFVFFKKNETKKLILVTNLHFFLSNTLYSNPIIKYIFQIKKNKAQILSKYVIIIILNN